MFLAVFPRSWSGPRGHLAGAPSTLQPGFCQCQHHISKFVTSDLRRPPLCSELSLLPPASWEGCLPWQGLRHAIQPLPAAGLPGDICVWTPAGQSPSARTSGGPASQEVLADQAPPLLPLGSGGSTPCTWDRAGQSRALVTFVNLGKTCSPSIWRPT